MPDPVKPSTAPRAHWVTDVTVLVSCSCGEVIDGLADKQGISNGRRIDQAVKLARQGLTNIEDP